MFPHLLGFLFITAVARLRRTFTVALALVPLHRRRRCCRSLSGRLGELGHIYFVVIRPAKLDLQSYCLEWRGRCQRRRRWRWRPRACFGRLGLSRGWLDFPFGVCIAFWRHVRG